MKARFEFQDEKSYQEYLRTYFAAMALQGLRASKLIKSQADGSNQNSDILWSSEMIAKLAIEDADEILKQLKNK